MLRDSDVRLVEEYSNLMQLDLASVCVTWELNFTAFLRNTFSVTFELKHYYCTTLFFF